MGVFSGWILMPLGILFLFSGLIINLLQVGTLLLLFPFSLNAYRRANIILMELLWSELVWLMDWWAGVKIRVYIDSETWNCMGKEHALVIANHRSDVDWLVGWVIAQRVGCLGSTRAVMKKSTKFLPVIGWSMWFSEYIFLERNWTKDENTLKSSFRSLEGFPRPFWLALFVEGTRFTQAKLLAAQEYAISAGLPIPRNVLIPRTKGFVSAVTNFRSFVPAVYDMTVAVPKAGPSTTMLRLLKGQPSVIHLHVRRYPMTELPKEEDDISHWCRDIFVAKDDFLDKHKENDSFGEELYKPIPRSSKPLIITIGWSALLLYALAHLLMPLLSTWTGVAWIVGGLVTIFSLMQFLILFTQSERSSPANPISSSTKAIKKSN